MRFSAMLEEHMRAVRSIDVARVSEMADDMVRVLRGGGKLLICGNGGSAADAQHFAAEMVVRFETDRKALPAIAITTDSSAMTAASNDFGYGRVFSRMVEAIGCPGDAILSLSTSGRSESVVRAQEVAASIGMRTWAITGEDGSPLADAADISLRICGRAARIQEATIVILHHLASVADASF